MAKKAEAIVLEFDEEKIKLREEEVAAETDEQILSRLGQRFEILTEMTKAVKNGAVRAMIVSGPPGVGKSFGVEEVLSKDDLFNTIADREPNYEIVKGTMSSVGLYAKLYEYSEAGSVLVFDDCDVLFYDTLALNILKAALDTGSKRYISWNTDSRLLRSEGIPDRFEFKGSVIFITNIKFAHVRSKTLKEHLNALESRCHYLDLQMDTSREKILRIKQIVSEGMLDKYNFGDDGVAEIVQFIEDNQTRLRELSLRMVLKIADLRKAMPAVWQSFAEASCMSRA